MKYFILLIIFFTTTATAQTTLNFDKRFVQSEDRWVAFTANEDGSHPYGFIYIDPQAGLTLNYEGTFKILSSGQFVPTKLDSTNMKVRLKANNVLVAHIPESKFEELKIAAVPDWLKYYKTDTNSVTRLYNWGYLYNGWGECAKALTYLQRAEKIDANFKGLGVELAYSYNCLGQHDKAIEVLKDALKSDPTDAYTNKELIYAQMKSGNLDEASKSCKKALSICTDKTYNGENCYNLLRTFYEKEDKSNFNAWLSEAKKWNANNKQLMNSIAAMEKEINK